MTGDVNDLMPGSDGLRILGDFWKKNSELGFEAGRREFRSDAGWIELIFGPGRGQLGLRDAPRVVGSDGTVSIVEIVSLSLRVENPKSQEGNKSFVPELPRVVTISSVFRIPMHVNDLHILIFE